MDDPIPPLGALHAPHTRRNSDPILSILTRALNGSSAVLEIGCGTGEQGPYFAAALPQLRWLPTDFSEAAVASAAAWRSVANTNNILTPVQLDAASLPWPLPMGFTPDVVVSINMIHIAPFAACEGLITGAGTLLGDGGVLFLYGPYKQNGAHTSPSNEMFDQSLRARDQSWGIRDLEAIIELARNNGFTHSETIPMPSNNLSVVFRHD
ncbi:MAG: SAM-dependent methyltransferase [Alphaproteobacteria bacterium]|jgi:SAM-dependent methyltransferase